MQGRSVRSYLCNRKSHICTAYIGDGVWWHAAFCTINKPLCWAPPLLCHSAAIRSYLL